MLDNIFKECCTEFKFVWYCGSPNLSSSVGALFQIAKVINGPVSEPVKYLFEQFRFIITAHLHVSDFDCF